MIRHGHIWRSSVLVQHTTPSVADASLVFSPVFLNGRFLGWTEWKTGSDWVGLGDVHVIRSAEY